MVKTIKIDDPTHEKLSELSQIQRINMGDIIAYVIDLIDKYDLMDPDWLDNLTRDKVSEYLQSHDSDLEKRMTIERAKAINQAKLYAFKKYIDVLDPDTRKGFLENILGNVNDEGFLDSISNYQMFIIDGTQKLCQVDSDGTPIVPGTNRSNLVACITGYHFLGAFCKCSKWRECDIRSKEYLNYLSRTDPNMKQEKTRRFTNNYVLRDDR